MARIVVRLGGCLGMCVSLAFAAQSQTDLLPRSQVPVDERLWTVQIFHGSNEAYRGESREVTNACGSFTGLTFDSWAACRARYVKPARYRIAVWHFAPNASSPITASLFEERRIASNNQLEFTWTVEPASRPGASLAWPESTAAFDYGLYIDGVQRRGAWVRILSAIPVDGWMRITPEGPAAKDSRLYVWVSSLPGQVVGLSPLLASFPDGHRQEITAGSYVINAVNASGIIEFRAEIPSDHPCGEIVTRPHPLPPTLHAPASEFFDKNGMPRFSTEYTKGC